MEISVEFLIIIILIAVIAGMVIGSSMSRTTHIHH